MSTTQLELTKKQIVWGLIKRSPVLSTITALIVTNLITIILTGGFNWILFATNLFPTIFAFFLSSMYNEKRNSIVEKNKKVRIIL